MLRRLAWGALFLWALYETRRLVNEHDQCHLEYIDNAAYLKQAMCVDPVLRAAWEGKRVHCSDAERANAEPRLDCAYRRWWEQSGWLMLLRRFTGDSWTIIAISCTSIASFAWLLSVVFTTGIGGGHRRLQQPPVYATIDYQQQQQRRQSPKVIYLREAPAAMDEDGARVEYDNEY